MIRAMVIKELRETWWIAAIGLGLYLWVVKCLMGSDEQPTSSFARFFTTGSISEVPFTGRQFLQPYILFSCLLALALGFRQTLTESLTGTYLFLLHRPWSRRAFFLTKLAVGVGLFWICGAIPILLFAAWAATPGNVPAPFEWSMTLNAWTYWLELPLVYLAAFLCGLRPAHWLGTRLLPLPAIALALLMLFVPWAWYLAAAGVVAAYATCCVVICRVAEMRDYA